jgi:Ca-activated chloride channel family protein
MSFLWPWMLLSVLVLPALVWAYRRQMHRHEQVRAQYRKLGLLPATPSGSAPWRRYLVQASFALGLLLLLVALARPQAALQLPRAEGTILLVFDVSGSMAATDLEPNRMETAKTLAREFVERQPAQIRIGVVAFSDSGLSIQQASTERADVLTAIARLTPQRGTSLGYGLFAALETLENDDPNAPPRSEGDEDERLYSNLPPATPEPVPAGSDRSKLIVLFTDGENTAEPEPLEAAQVVSDRGIRIFPIGIGTTEGAVLELEGFQVFSSLNEELLDDLADLSAGTYFNASTVEDFNSIYQDLELELVVRAEKMEITALLAGFGLLLLMIGGVASMLWFGRVP